MSRRPAVLALVLTFLSASTFAASLEPQLRQVEAIRGLKFTGDVKTAAIDRSELPKRLREQMELTSPYPLSEWTPVLRALQLVDSKSDDLVPDLIDLYQSQVLAYYDPFTRTYYSINQLPEAVAELAGSRELLEQGVVLHELTHALQDQHFEIGKKTAALRKDTDAAMAYHAVIEGEATLVMMAHMLTQAGASLDDLVKNEKMLTALMTSAASDTTLKAGTAPYFAESLKFPYLQGLSFVVAAYKRGGWKAISAIHSDPPRSTREVLHPDDYFDRKFRAAKWVEKPLVPGAKVLALEHLGEFHLAFIVGADNARGWLSDRVTIAQNAKKETTVLVETTWETPGRATVFAEAYEKFLRGRGVAPRIRRDGANVRVAYGADQALMESYLP